MSVTQKKIIASGGVVVIAAIFILWLLSIPTRPFQTVGGAQHVLFDGYPERWSPSPITDLGFSDFRAGIYVTCTDKSIFGNKGFSFENDPWEGQYHCLNNQIVGSWFTCPRSGRAENITVFMNMGGSTHRDKCAIYRVDDNSLVGVADKVIGKIGYYRWAFEFSPVSYAALVDSFESGWTYSERETWEDGAGGWCSNMFVDGGIVADWFTEGTGSYKIIVREDPPGPPPPGNNYCRALGGDNAHIWKVFDLTDVDYLTFDWRYFDPNDEGNCSGNDCFVLFMGVNGDILWIHGTTYVYGLSGHAQVNVEDYEGDCYLRFGIYNKCYNESGQSSADFHIWYDNLRTPAVLENNPELVGGEDYWLVCWAPYSSYIFGDSIVLPEPLDPLEYIILIIVIAGAVITMVWAKKERR